MRALQLCRLSIAVGRQAVASCVMSGKAPGAACVRMGAVCCCFVQVAARSDAPDRAGRSRHEQNSLLALSLLTTLASFLINLFGARRLFRAAKAATSRISQGIVRTSAAAPSALKARSGSRGQKVAPNLLTSDLAHEDTSEHNDAARAFGTTGPWERALHSDQGPDWSAERSQSSCVHIALR